MEYLVNFLAVLAAVLFGFLIRNYWPKYFEAKAQNQATKEDIGEITRIVESIKGDLQKQSEMIKAQIALENSHTLNIKNVEREAIFGFNKTLTTWIESIALLDNVEYDNNNYEGIKIRIKDISNRHYEYELASAHLFLIIEDEKLRDIVLDLVLKALEFERKVLDILNDLYSLCSSIDWALEKADEQQEITLINQFFEEQSNLTNKFYKIIRSDLDSVYQIRNEVVDMLRLRIKDIYKN